MKEESDMELPLVFEPNGEAEGDQPSQTTINWSFSKEGIVKISQSRGEYDNYASKTFVLTALSEGEVEVTGTPVVAKDGVEPLKFKVQVTESDVQPRYLSKTENLHVQFLQGSQSFACRQD